jgi:hypothetical protein
MIKIRHALAACILLPAAAGAQMGRSSTMSRTGEADAKKARSAIDQENVPLMKLKVADLEDISPLKLLVDKRKDLKLTDDQQTKLKELRSTVDKTNEPTMAKFDSLRIVMRPRPNMTDAEQVRMAIGREELGPLVSSIRANYDASAAQAMALLDEAQKATAQGLLEKQAKDADQMIREKLGRTGGGPAGGPPGGRGGRPPND